MLRKQSPNTGKTNSVEIGTGSPVDDSSSKTAYSKGRKERTRSIRLKRLALYLRRDLKQLLCLITGSIGVAFILFSCISENNDQQNRRLFITSRHFQSVDQSFDVIFNGWSHSSDSVVRIPTKAISKKKKRKRADYGGLEIDFFEEEDAVRYIFRDYSRFDNRFRPPDQDYDDDLQLYYAFDDDILRDKFGRDHHHGHDKKRLPDEIEPECRRVADHRLNFPTCNNYHEIDFIESNAHYLNQGAYRQVLVAEHPYGNTVEKVILKDLQFTMNATMEHYEFVRMDAIVAERLTASPRIYDIYTMCGLGIVSEFFQHGDMERVVIPHFHAQTKEGYDNLNDLNPYQKLVAAKQMADGIADLHGYKGGVIVHQDIQPSQFLMNADQDTIKLNDFNRAEFMLYNEKKGEYCKYYEGMGMGTWRSAEEYYDQGLNEKVDIFSLGNNYFGILTGIQTWHELDVKLEIDQIQHNIRHGMKAPIDPGFRNHSIEEKQLAQLIDWCHEHNPDDRPSIFQVVDFLDTAIKESEAAQGKNETVALQKFRT